MSNTQEEMFNDKKEFQELKERTIKLQQEETKDLPHHARAYRDCRKFYTATDFEGAGLVIKYKKATRRAEKDEIPLNADYNNGTWIRNVFEGEDGIERLLIHNFDYLAKALINANVNIGDTTKIKMERKISKNGNEYYEWTVNKIPEEEVMVSAEDILK